MTASTQSAPGSGPRGTLLPADPWFAIEWQPDDVLRIWEPHVSRLLRANMFLVRGRDRDLLIDGGMGVASLRRFLGSLLDKPVVMLLTHAHVDHVGAAAEFPDELLIHAREAELLAEPPTDMSIRYDDYPEARKAELRAAGFDTEGYAIAALPHAGYDPQTWSIEPVQATRLVGEGDVVDLGDRHFDVLHLPGHSPGSIGLWEEATKTLIGGDAIYDGLIIDTLAESDPAAYRLTMERIGALGANIVHGGHRESFGPAKLKSIVDGYLNHA